MTISEISTVLKNCVENTFCDVSIIGEVQYCQAAPSGHKYITLKEKDDILDAICWKGTKTTHDITPGELMVFDGKITTYSKRCKYQLIIKEAKFESAGKILQKIEELKIKLRNEGLFDKKRPLPEYPEKIGIITSETGAVIEDMKAQFQRCVPSKIILFSATVQGNSAVEEIKAGLRYFNSEKLVDVIVIARGGGSAEDLIAFNDESVAREVFASKVPVVSGIGHETDTTLCDCVSDVRAPTPTAAALLVLPLKETEVQQVNQLHEQAKMHVAGICNSVQDALENARNANRYFMQLCAGQKQWVDSVHLSAKTSVKRLCTIPAVPKPAIDKNVLQDLISKKKCIQIILDRVKMQLEKYLLVVESCNPQNVLKRGFCLVSDHAGNCITSVERCKKDSKLKLEFSDGKQGVTVD